MTRWKTHLMFGRTDGLYLKYEVLFEKCPSSSLRNNLQVLRTALTLKTFEKGFMDGKALSWLEVVRLSLYRLFIKSVG